MVILSRQVHNKKSLKDFRKQLRNNPTPSEAELWKYLNNRQLENRKFRRQHSIGNYIVDFYCPEERLIIELDGGVHLLKEQREADKERDEVLRDMGFNILRLKNVDVLQNIEQVLIMITRNFRIQTFSFNSPSLIKEGDRGR